MEYRHTESPTDGQNFQ